MTRRRLIATFVGWHLVAIAVASLPAPRLLNSFPERNSAEALNPVFYRVTLALDGLARAAAVVETGLWWVTRPLHPAVVYYTDLTGVAQSWAMFSNPPTTAQYMRIRYYVQPNGGRPWVATELVVPANREDRVRTFQSFRDSYRDKAISIASGQFFERRNQKLIAPETRPEQLPNDLAPIARYFAREFTQTRLSERDTIVRTEVWIGNAPIAPLGATPDETMRLERAVVLQNYYDGPVEQRIRIPEYPPYHGDDREADISWLLEYYEER